MNNHTRSLADKIKPSQPKIFSYRNPTHKKQVGKLLLAKKINSVINDYKKQLKELFAIENPSLYFSQDFSSKFEQYYKKLTESYSEEELGNWVYFPWNSTLIHILPNKEFQKVRTARNRNLTTEKEQEAFYSATVGIAGLSVGNSIALAITLQGGSGHIKLADGDSLELTNLNRIRGSICDLSSNKAEMTARQIYELNPYAKIEIFREGLTEKNIDRFMSTLNIMIDEIDNLAIKHLIRQKAQKYKIPVVMAADNGEGGIVDIERYDLNPKTKFFHGRMGNVSYQQLKQLNKFGIGQHIVKLLDPNNITQRTYESFLEMGKSLASWPQLGGAALLNGSAVAYCVKKITAGQKLQNNRAIISLEDLFIPDYNSSAQKTKRIKITKRFKKILGL